VTKTSNQTDQTQNTKVEKITKQAIEDLNNAVAVPAVTIYAPTHRSASPPHMSEDQIRIKNLINAAERELRARPDGKELADQICSLLDRLMADQSFWEHQTEGLLICAWPDNVQMFHLPIDTEEYVAVDSGLHLAPVLAMTAVSALDDFYVLTVTQQKPELFIGNLYGLQPSGIDLPESLNIGLNIDENNQKSEHWRAVGGTNATAFNGRGGARDPRQEDEARFWRLIDQIILDKVDRNKPLILAGTDADTTDFRSLSKHPHILSQTISINYGENKQHDLFEPAYGVFSQELIKPNTLQAIETFEQLSGTSPTRVATKPGEIEEAASEGRVDTLLVGMSRFTTDTVRDNNQPVQRLTFPDKISHKANSLAQAVVRMKGRVINIDIGQLPGNATMLATLRY
jgi:hypothetical protein